MIFQIVEQKRIKNVRWRIPPSDPDSQGHKNPMPKLNSAVERVRQFGLMVLKRKSEISGPRRACSHRKCAFGAIIKVQKSILQGGFKTPKNINIDAIATENGQNEKVLLFFIQNFNIFPDFPGDLRSGNDIYIS